MYQDYKFLRNNRYYLKNNGEGSRGLVYRCSEADEHGCKAYLRVNTVGDVLAAFVEHNHMPKPDEELEMTDQEKVFTTGKLRCTKRQIQYLINFMIKNKDLASSVRNAENRYKIQKKWQTLAFNLATIGLWKPIKHLKVTWRDLKKGARAEIVQLVSHSKDGDKCVPTDRTCKVFEALGHPIPENVGSEELSDILAKSKPSGNEKQLSNLVKQKIVPSKAKARYVKQSPSITVGKRERCTRRQITFLIDYMVQNKELALGTLKGSESHKKWLELESKMAAIGPWKSAKHLMGTWRELKKYARKKSIVAPGEEQPQTNTMKVINLMGLPVVCLEPSETADHDYTNDSHVAPTSAAVDTGESDDDTDSSSNWPIYEVDSYP